MMRHRLLQRTAAFLTSLLLTISFLPVYGTSVTDAGIDINRRGSIIAKVKYYPVGSTFHLYKVADIQDGLQYVYTDDFKEAAASINISADSTSGTTNHDWMQAAKELDAFVQGHNIEGETTQVKAITDTDNGVIFTSLPIGLYLLKGDDYADDAFTVTSQPCLISIPNRLSTASAWTYDINIEVKVEDPNWISPTPTPISTPTTTPEITETPVITSTPETPGNTEVKTGDTFKQSAYMMILLIDAAVIILYIAIRHKNRQNEQ